jgi:hypothetical protein
MDFLSMLCPESHTLECMQWLASHHLPVTERLTYLRH